MEPTKAAKGEKFRVNTAALVDLKAALYHKQQQAKKERTTTTQDVRVNRDVSEKTSSIWKNVKSTDKKNKNKAAKNSKTSRQEASDSVRELSIQEERELAKSRQALEAKAALYDRLRQGIGLREELEGEEEEENGPRYMVDFTKKIWQETQEKQQTEKTDQCDEGPVEPKMTDDVAPSSDPHNEDDEWVDFVDSLGRSRRCLKKDLAHYQDIDSSLVANKASETARSPSPDLLSDDMRRERERLKWEAEQEVDEEQPTGPLHYQAVRGGEIRSHGIGYYAFSTDEAKRKEQIELLDKLRNQTLTQREKRQKLQERRKAMMDARLDKIRKRKLKEKGIEVEEKTDIAEFDFEKNDNKKKTEENPDIKNDLSQLLSEAMEQSRVEQEKEADERRASHVRPWDKGKVVDPIRKRKQELRDERLTEFAPPSSYFDGSSEKPSESKKTKPSDDHHGPHQATTEDRTLNSSTVVTSAASYSYPPPQYFGAAPPFPFPPPPQFSNLPPGAYPPMPPYPFVPPPYPPGVTMTPPGVGAPPYVMRPPPPPPGIPPTLTQTTDER